MTRHKILRFVIPVVFNKLIKVECMFQSNTTYKCTMKYQSNTTQLYVFYYCTRATCFGSYRIIFRPFLEGTEKDSIRIETCCSSTIIKKIKNLCCVWLILHCIFIYVLNTSGWKTLKKTYKVALDSNIHSTLIRHDTKLYSNTPLTLILLTWRIG